MPNITVEFIQGRSHDQKRKLVAAITDAVAECLSVAPLKVRVRLIEIPRDQLAKGGRLYSDGIADKT